MDDEDLVREAVGGSIPAFTAIFERYEAQVHDFSLALVRDRDVALAVAQATFLEASERLDALTQPDRLRVWLLSITRYQAALQVGAEAGLDRQPAEPAPVEAGEGWTAEDAERAHQAGLVWEATADLPLRERALLDLYLRQGLEGNDLGDALGVSPDEAAELRAGLATIEKGLAGFLIARRADRSCPDLPLLLRGWDGRFNHLIATHLAAHVDSCRVCSASALTLSSPFALYAWAPRAPLPGSAATAAAPASGTGATELPPDGEHPPPSGWAAPSASPAEPPRTEAVQAEAVHTEAPVAQAPLADRKGRRR